MRRDIEAADRMVLQLSSLLRVTLAGNAAQPPAAEVEYVPDIDEERTAGVADRRQVALDDESGGRVALGDDRDVPGGSVLAQRGVERLEQFGGDAGNRNEGKTGVSALDRGAVAVEGPPVLEPTPVATIRCRCDGKGLRLVHPAGSGARAAGPP